MYAFIVIVIFLLILAIIVYREYKNEKSYQEERKERHAVDKKKKRTVKKSPKHISSYTPKKPLQQKLDSAIQTVERASREKKTQNVEIQKQKVTEKDIQKNNLDMPKYNYVQFNHSRLVKMGFSDTEAKEFVLELIPQIASQMPSLQEAIEKKDLALIDEITHDIKGASGNIGSGGITDLMNDLNTYIKKGDDTEVLQAYYKHVEHYYKELKQQYQA